MPPNDEIDEHEPCHNAIERLKGNIANLLTTLGGPSTNCRKCQKRIWFIENPKTGKKMPITVEALNHFADCPNARSFRPEKTPALDAAKREEQGPKGE